LKRGRKMKGRSSRERKREKRNHNQKKGREQLDLAKKHAKKNRTVKKKRSLGYRTLEEKEKCFMRGEARQSRSTDTSQKQGKKAWRQGGTPKQFPVCTRKWPGGDML